MRAVIHTRYGAPEGTFIVPGRTAVVFVIEKGE